MFTIMVTPRMVTSEPIQPMTPRYITRIEVAISGARESPKVCARSWVESIWSPPDRNEYALAKVNINKAKPMLRVVTPEKAILHLKVLNMYWSTLFND